MKNVTITLDDDTAHLARVRAAEQDMSLSRYISEIVSKDIRESNDYQEAMRRYFNSTLVIHRHPDERRPSRDELHDREGLRS